MDKILIRGGMPLSGTIPIAGAKNAALPLMAACLLTDEPLVLANLPDLADIKTMADLLAQHGVSVTTRRAGQGMPSHVLELSAREITSTTAPYDLVRKMRASFLVLGPLVARCGAARVSLPGGDEIGVRPVDLHIKGLQRLGAEVELSGGYIEARAPNGLKGAEITFPSVSVGATETPADGGGAGGRRERADQRRARARDHRPRQLPQRDGRADRRHRHRPADRARRRQPARRPPHGDPRPYRDRNLCDGGGRSRRARSIWPARGSTISKRSPGFSKRADIRMHEADGGILVRRSNGRIDGVDVMTEPYPGFPTDLQAQVMALMTIADGAAMITETIFENRFMHVPELMRLGANINVQGPSALVRGVKRLAGAEVMATDLRASVSLVIAGLIAEGETVINRVHHLDRGYERLEDKLAACGARIERVRGGA